MNTAAFRSAVAAALFLAATHAFSQDGFYLSAAAMATFAGPHDFAIGSKPAEGADFAANRKGSGSFEVGILGFRAAFGYGIFGFRPEAELSYQQVGLSGYHYSSFSLDGAEISDSARNAVNDSVVVKSGNLVLLGAMANLWFDIPTGSPISLYLGGGAGLGRVTLSSRARARLPGAGGVQDYEHPESSASAFAFQTGAGMGFELGGGLSLSLGYRLSGTSEAELAWNAKNSQADELLKVSVLLHSIDLGVAFRF